ncbi:MAG TPA: nitroreductase family protein [Clostridia bacterium]|nr:nitroreductase family protein [Clostridia bacterium]HPQ47465.1 nitroreductase family protein [Clostridia bacterium]HRX42841.1 nitroreductase family protein [Clostridia bacterium]
MEFAKLAAMRQSTRKFEDRPVERELLEKCIEAARLAPSACNAQPWKYIIVDDPELVKELASLTYNNIVKFNKFTDNAAAFAVVVLEPGTFASHAGSFFTNLDYAFIDMGISVENFCLQATELGIGTCILGWSRQKEIKKLLDIPRNKRVGVLIAIGYEKDYKLRNKSRKPLEEMRSFNKY